LGFFRAGRRGEWGEEGRGGLVLVFVWVRAGRGGGRRGGVFCPPRAFGIFFGGGGALHFFFGFVAVGGGGGLRWGKQQGRGGFY